jgi:hypothetical protein
MHGFADPKMNTRIVPLLPSALRMVVAGAKTAPMQWSDSVATHAYMQSGDIAGIHDPSIAKPATPCTYPPLRPDAPALENYRSHKNK